MTDKLCNNCKKNPCKCGRPKRQFTDEEIQKIEQYARNNCHNRTISTALNIPVNTLTRRFGTKIRRWRAAGKVELRQLQRDLAKTSSDMAKFLGINELGQQIKQVIETGPTDSKPKTEQELEAARAGAKAFNEAMSKTNIIPIKEAKRHV